MDTCLFTGQVLSPENKKEHAIQKKLGGKIVSRRITSSSFNEASSQVDDLLVDQYLALLVHLRPLLPKSSRLGNRYGQVEVDGAMLPTVLKYGGGPELRQGIHQIAQSDASTHKTYYFRTPSDKEKLLTSLKPDPGSVREERKMIDKGAYTYSHPVEFSWKVEIAALKAALLAFDALLLEQGGLRFTRARELSEVREFVRGAVLLGPQNQADFVGQYDRHVMGFQFNKMPEIQSLREKYGPPPTSDFEHILIATGNAATHTVDLVWLICGIDPFGFRLTHDWHRPSFTCLLTAGLLAGEEGNRPLIWPAPDFYVCEKTKYCATGRDVAREGYEALVAEWRTQREKRYLEACGKAIFQVEMQCDETVTENLAKSFRETALCGHCHARPMNLIAGKLHRMYYHQLCEPAVRQDVCQWIRRLREHWQSLPLRAKDQDWSLPAAWHQLLPVYRKALNAMKSKHGGPGDLRTDRVVDFG